MNGQQQLSETASRGYLCLVGCRAICVVGVGNLVVLIAANRAVFFSIILIFAGFGFAIDHRELMVSGHNIAGIGVDDGIISGGLHRKQTNTANATGRGRATLSACQQGWEAK